MIRLNEGEKRSIAEQKRRRIAEIEAAAKVQKPKGLLEVIEIDE